MRSSILPRAMRQRLASCSWLVGALAVSGCGEVTYWQDVQPLVERNCVSCHQPGGIGPFSLAGYQEVASRAAAIADATADRRMPPWLATADGSCGDFDEPLWLSSSEIALLRRWASSGSPEGLPPESLPELPDPPTLGASALAVTISNDYTPQPHLDHPDDDYRCFALETGLSSSGFVSAVEVVPGTPHQVHHVLAFTVDPELDLSGATNAEIIASLDAQDAPAGWSCYGGLGEGIVPNNLLSTWAPGENVTRVPEGRGIPISDGELLVVQVHYNVDDTPDPDSSSVRLQIEADVSQPVYSVLVHPFLDTLFAGSPASLPAGQRKATFEWNVPLSAVISQLPSLSMTPTGVELLGVFPHMHELGAQFDLSIAPPSGVHSMCAVEIEDWDFHWQRSYFYSEPERLPASTVLRGTCTYDTTSRSEPVLPGFGTHDEMCMLGVYVTPTFD